MQWFEQYAFEAKQKFYSLHLLEQARKALLV
jgi:hypothetical protein